jgi:hypothetical protein
LGFFSKLTAILGVGMMGIPIPQYRIFLYGFIDSMNKTNMVITVGGNPDHSITVFIFNVLYLKDEYSGADNVNIYMNRFALFP